MGLLTQIVAGIGAVASLVVAVYFPPAAAVTAALVAVAVAGAGAGDACMDKHAQDAKKDAQAEAENDQKTVQQAEQNAPLYGDASSVDLGASREVPPAA